MQVKEEEEETLRRMRPKKAKGIKTSRSSGLVLEMNGEEWDRCVTECINGCCVHGADVFIIGEKGRSGMNAESYVIVLPQ